MLVKRVSNLLDAVVGERVTELELAHAGALLGREREELAARVARFDAGLALHAAQCERLAGDITRSERELTRVEERLERELARDARALAARSAMRREELLRALDGLRARHGAAEDDYGALRDARNEAIEAARARLDALRRAIDEQRTSSALADLTELAASLELSMRCGDGTVERLELGLRARKEHALGRLRVARDGRDGTGDARAERAREAEAALARYESERPR